MHSKYVSLYSQISIVYIPHHGNSFATGDNNKDTQPIKDRAMESSFNGYIHKLNPEPNDQETLQKQENKDYKSQWIGKFAVKLYLLRISEVSPVKYLHCDCISMNWTCTTKIVMLIWMEEST